MFCDYLLFSKSLWHAIGFLSFDSAVQNLMTRSIDLEEDKAVQVSEGCCYTYIIYYSW